MKAAIGTQINECVQINETLSTKTDGSLILTQTMVCPHLVYAATFIIISEMLPMMRKKKVFTLLSVMKVSKKDKAGS